MFIYSYSILILVCQNSFFMFDDYSHSQNDLGGTISKIIHCNEYLSNEYPYGGILESDCLHSFFWSFRREGIVPMHRGNFSFQWILWLRSKNLCSLRNTFQMFTYFLIPHRQLSFKQISWAADSESLHSFEMLALRIISEACPFFQEMVFLLSVL